jgi:lysophospholipase L1-like esterase
MRNTLLLAGLFLLLSTIAAAQKKVVVMGSSTSAGTGASTYDSSWVGRFQKFYRQNVNDNIDTVVHNLAWYGQTSYHQMPTGWVSPVANRPAVDQEHNVSKAISLSPDIVIINLPSNDVANLYWPGSSPLYTTKETMDNFRYMKQVLNNNGIKTYFTTTQPRNDMDFTKRQMQAQLLDSIRNNFAGFVLNFWDPLVTSDGQYMLRADLKSDDIHPNDIGHRLLFNQAIAANVFGSAFIQLPSKIEAEDFIAMNGVRIENTSDDGGGRNVGYIDQGDWMDYNVNATRAGSYTLNIRLATPGSNGQLQVRNTAGTVLAVMNVPVTGGWQAWQTVNTSVSLPAGNQTLRIIATGTGNWNINWLNFSQAPALMEASTNKIEAEDYTSMSGVQTENTTDIGGGKNVGYIDPGDWMEYHFQSPSAQSYSLKLRISSPYNTARVEVRNAAGNVLGAINIPNTGGWQSWQTVSVPVTLPAGAQVIRVVSVGSGYWNINWLEFTTESSLPYTQIPARIEAELWTAMSGVQKESTLDAGGGQNVGYIDNGDWMEYNIQVPATRNYVLSFRLASTNTSAQFQVKQGSNILATVTVPNTGGYQSWTTQSIVVSLTAGPQTIRLVSTAWSPWNINWLEFSDVNTTSIAKAFLPSEEISSSSKGGFEIFPNPISDRFNMTVNNDYTGRMQLNVVDMSGNIVQQFILNKIKTGAQVFPVSLKGSPQGNYMLVLHMGGSKLSRKIFRK